MSMRLADLAAVVAAACVGMAVLLAHRLLVRAWGRRLLDRWARAEGVQIMLCRSLTRLPWPLLRHSFRILALDARGGYRNARATVRPLARGEGRVLVRWDERR